MLLKLLIATFLSILVFTYFFWFLNNSKLRLFISIQNKLHSISNKKTIKITTFIFIVLIMFLLLILNVNNIIIGLITGFLISLRDICFKNTFIDILKLN